MLLLRTSPEFVAEKTYACTVLLSEILGIQFQLEFQPGAKNYQILLPNGDEVIIEDHFFAKQSGDNYLSAANIPEQAISFTNPFDPQETLTGIYGRAHYSKQEKSSHCGIDLFASAFFMLSRWEEYVLPERDAFGRFPAKYALSVRSGFLDRPVVNEYANFLRQMLEQAGWQEPRKSRSFNFQLSCDVDHPRLWWSTAARLRTLGGSIFQRKNLLETGWWLKNHIFTHQDPFDIFDDWMDLFEKNGLLAHFNFLGERPKTSDCYYPLQHPFVLQLMQKIHARGHNIGFHPSREAWADPLVFEQELNSLRSVSPQSVTTGRQHFLCFSAPDTWQHWADAGMDWDSSMGYPEAEGFRCGICQPFPVFNFKTKKTLALYEKPLIAMDVTLAQYRNYSPNEALERLLLLRRQVAKHGGEFVLLWHNSSWNTYFWAPWQRVFLEFLGTVLPVSPSPRVAP